MLLIQQTNATNKHKIMLLTKQSTGKIRQTTVGQYGRVVSELAYVSRSTHLMGATITISLLPPQNDAQMECSAEQLLNGVFDLLHIYNQRFSANDANSELMQVNHAAGKHPITVHPELFELIQIGKEQSLLPASHLNIAIGPLVQTWRIGFIDAHIPNKTEIAHALALTDPQLIELDPLNCTVFLAKEGMKLDLGCLAKGYIADKIADYLKSRHVTSALINLGGNIKTIGANLLAGRPWQIGIQDPQQPRGTNLAVLPIRNQSAVTSGTYERKLQVNGKSYHHILDRDTGYPVDTQLASITIISGNSLDGEIWTTRLYGEKPNQLLARVEQEKDIDALIITNDNRVYYSSGISPELLA